MLNKFIWNLDVEITGGKKEEAMKLVEQTNPRTEIDLTKNLLIFQYKMYTDMIKCQNFPKQHIYNLSQNIIYNIYGVRERSWRP